MPRALDKRNKGMKISTGTKSGIYLSQVPNRLKMFTWRQAHNSLAVRRNIARREVKRETICLMCDRADEDCGHLFMKCKGVKECWRAMDVEQVRVQMLNCRTRRVETGC